MGQGEDRKALETIKRDPSALCLAFASRREQNRRTPFGMTSHSKHSRFSILGGDDDWRGSFAPAFHFDFAVVANCACHHAAGVEWSGDIALMIERNDPAFAVLIDELFHHYIVGSLLERDVKIAHALADIGGDDVTHEKFSHARPRDAA